VGRNNEGKIQDQKSQVYDDPVSYPDSGVYPDSATAKNNIVRVAFQAMAAVLGGTQSLHTNSMDEALCLPSEEAVQIALRTQQLIAYETGVTDTVDPLARVFTIWKNLTNEIYERPLPISKRLMT